MKDKYEKPKGKEADATTPVITRKDPEDGFTRTAIRLTKGHIPSIDVIGRGGELLARINIFGNDDDTWGDIDVILTKDKQGTFLAWNDGKEVVREAPEGVTVYAIDIRKKDKGGDKHV